MKTRSEFPGTSKGSYKIGSPIWYDGPTCDRCITSYQTLIRDMAIEAGIEFPTKSLHIIDNSIMRFVQSFFNEARKIKSSSEAELFAENCKARYSDLLNASVLISTNDYDKSAFSFVLVSGNDGYSIKLTDLHYFPKSLKGFLITLMQSGTLVDAIALEKEPRFYIFLYKAMFEIIRVLNQIPDDIPDDIKNQMILMPSSLGQIFQKTNPTDEVLEQAAVDLLDLLRQPGIPLDQNFIDLFNQVRDDILQPGRGSPYIRSFKKAMKKISLKKFSSHDYYATLKSSPSRISRIEGKEVRDKVPSFLASLFENDVLRGYEAVTEFDHLVGYNSSYLTPDELDEKGIDSTTLTVKTTMIHNPSKHKGRGIHIGANSIQDRCNWLHHQLQPFLNELPCDCMDLHQTGVRFLKEITSPEYRYQNQNNIFVSDFSNATDTLNQEFQCLCLGILFPKQVVDFWRIVSQIPKEFYMPNSKKYIHYTQETGQPQGLLASFDSFSLAHHILMLMLMKMNHLENQNSERFYRILGDDSIVSFPCEIDTLYNDHSWLCKCCDLKKNDSKTGKSFFNDDMTEFKHEILDFAHISVRDGVFCTPLPFGLGSSYSEDPAKNKIAAVIWYGSRDIYFKRLLHHIIFDCYGRKGSKEFVIAEAIINSGQIPYLKGFEDPQVNDMIDSALIGASIFSYGISELQNSIFDFFISEETRQKKIRDQVDFEKVWKGFILSDLIDQLSSKVGSNHKFWILLNEAEALSDDIRALYDLNDPVIISCISGLVHRVGIDKEISNIINRIDFINLEFDTDDFYMSLCGIEYSLLFNNNKLLSQTKPKSFRSSDSKNISRFLRNAIRETNKRFSSSSQYKEWLSQSSLKLLDYYCTHVYSQVS